MTMTGTRSNGVDVLTDKGENQDADSSKRKELMK